MEQKHQTQIRVTTTREMVQAIETGRSPRYDATGRELNDLTIFSEAHMVLRDRLLGSLQEHLNSIEGSSLSGTTEMREFAAALMGTLDSLGNLRLEVPRGRHTGDRGRLMVVHAGPNQEPRFAIQTQTTNFKFYAEGKTIPRLKLAVSPRKSQ